MGLMEELREQLEEKIADIEFRYKSMDDQEKEKGYITGYGLFDIIYPPKETNKRLDDSEQREELKSLKNQYENFKIYFHIDGFAELPGRHELYRRICRKKAVQVCLEEIDSGKPSEENKIKVLKFADQFLNLILNGFHFILADYMAIKESKAAKKYLEQKKKGLILDSDPFALFYEKGWIKPLKKGRPPMPSTTRFTKDLYDFLSPVLHSKQETFETIQDILSCFYGIEKTARSIEDIITT